MALPRRGQPGASRNAKVWQGVAAGFLATGGVPRCAVLGTGTVAMMPRAGWLLRWLYPGQHLLAAVANHRELTASMNASGYGTLGYGWILLAFPIIGLIMGASGSSWAHNVTSGDPGSPHGRRRSAGS